MRASRANINSEMRELKGGAGDRALVINYQRLIGKQQEAIQSLKSQILLLKSYISLQKVCSPFELNCSDISLNNTSTTSSQSQLRGDLEESVPNPSSRKYEHFYSKISQLLQLPDLGHFDEELVIDGISKLKDTVIRKQQPIFIQRVKEIKVPITVQKIVEKIVERIVEKIVYVDKPLIVERIVQRPAFKEKIAERFVEKKQEQRSQPSGLNRTYSQKAFKAKKNDQHFNESRYQQKIKYDNYRKPETTGSNLIKKRVDQRKPYYRKDY